MTPCGAMLSASERIDSPLDDGAAPTASQKTSCPPLVKETLSFVHVIRHANPRKGRNVWTMIRICLSSYRTMVSPRSTPERAGCSIRVTARLTALPPDTLRVWERRYGFPKPERAAGGSRLYSAEDVETLVLLASALKVGYRPSEVVGKPRAEVARLVALAHPRGAMSTGLPTIDSLIEALATDDVASVKRELRQASVLLGPKRFVTDLAQPLSVRVGEEWANGKLEVRHEHVMSACLSTQLRLLASAFDERPGHPIVLLATLPSESHGLGLEMIALYLALHDVTPRLVGVDTPPEQIVRAAKSHNADAVGIAVVRPTSLGTVAKQLRTVIGDLPRRTRVWLGGGAARDLDLQGDVRVVSTWPELDAAITSLAHGPL